MADLISLRKRAFAASGGVTTPLQIDGTTGDIEVADWRMFRSDGAPTTQFNNLADTGDLCIDFTNGVLYINEGSLATNSWAIVGLQS